MVSRAYAREALLRRAGGVIWALRAGIVGTFGYFGGFGVRLWDVWGICVESCEVVKWCRVCAGWYVRFRNLVRVICR